jgi:tetratricopeptide (TPR) repeat protein
LKRLTHLNLFNCVSITDAGIETLVRLPAVEELNLGSCVFPYEDEQTCGLTDKAAARLSELRTLRHLGLTGNRVRPETVARLREALPGCLIDASSMVRSEIVEACNEGEMALSGGDLNGALSAYRKALASDEAYPPALLGAARVQERLGDLAAAVASADRAVETDREAESFYVRGVLRARAGRSAEAIADYTRGLEADGRRSDLLIWRAEARLDAKDHAGAIEDYTLWLARASGGDAKQGEWLQWLPHVLSNRSYARLETGDPAGAEADSALVVELSPGSVEALMNRAEARTKLGRKAEARKDYEAVLKLQPDHREAKRLLSEL